MYAILATPQKNKLHEMSQMKLLQDEKLACYLFFKISDHAQIWWGFLFQCWCTKEFSL